MSASPRAAVIALAAVALIAAGLLAGVDLSAARDAPVERGAVVVPAETLECAAAHTASATDGQVDLRVIAVGPATDLADVDAPVVGAVVGSPSELPARFDGVVVSRMVEWEVHVDPALVGSTALGDFLEDYRRTCAG